MQKLMKPESSYFIIRFISIGLFGSILLNFPGQNTIQTHISSSNLDSVKGINIDISQNKIPIKSNTNVPDIELSAKAAFAIDVNSGVVLFEKNSQIKLMPASTTKIMTALVALDEYALNDVIFIKDENYSIGSKSDLKQGEQITVENTLKALLISSGNDAALALAQHHPSGYYHFVDLMNQKAKEIHLTNSHFANVSGVEQSNHYMSARDLAILSKEAMKNDFFKETVSTLSTVFSSADNRFNHQIKNTNELLEIVEGVNGIKTGWTNEAGECLVTSVDRNGRQVITVVLGSNDRFGESKILIDWIFSSYSWTEFPLDTTQLLPVPR